MDVSSRIETNKLRRSRKESRGGKMDLFFEKRERQAQTFIRFMRSMEQVSVPEFEGSIEYATSGPHADIGVEINNDDRVFDEVIMSGLEDVTAEMRLRLKSVWKQWANKTREVSAFIKQELRDHALADEDFGNEELMGSKLFTSLTNEKPKGSVHFLNKGPTVYFSFADNDDFNKFVAQTAGYSEEDDEAAGLHLPHVTWTHRSYRESSLSIVVQRKESPDKQMILHESQHFINHALTDSFGIVEQKGRQRSTEHALEAEHTLKDELLAYLRDGSSPDRIISLLDGRNKLYASIYDGLDEQAQMQIKTDLNNICETLKKHPWVYTSFSEREIRDGVIHDPNKEHKRELLVASLIDIALPDMQKYLSASAEHYQRLRDKWENEPPLYDSTDSEEERILARSADNERYNKSMGFIPEYGKPVSTLELQMRENESRLENEPPPLPPDNTPEDQRRFIREQEERDAMKVEVVKWKADKQQRQSRRLDQW